jgi:hypothetical protein
MNQYENYKKFLQTLNLTPAEYVAEIKRYCKENKI